MIPHYVFCEQPGCSARHVVLFEHYVDHAVYKKRGVCIEIYGRFRCRCPECGHRTWYFTSRDTITIWREEGLPLNA